MVGTSRQEKSRTSVFQATLSSQFILSPTREMFGNCALVMINIARQSDRPARAEAELRKTPEKDILLKTQFSGVYPKHE